MRKKGMKSPLLLMIMQAAIASQGGGSLYTNYPDYPGKPKNNPDYKARAPHRELKEFCINGRKVMAYSRKDAIVRLRHKG